MEQMIISRRDFASRCGLSHTYVNRLARNGSLPVVDGGLPVPEALFALMRALPADGSMAGAYKATAETIRGLGARIDLHELAVDLWVARDELLEEAFLALADAFDRGADRLLGCRTREEIAAALDDIAQEAYSPLRDRVDAGPYATGWSLVERRRLEMAESGDWKTR